MKNVIKKMILAAVIVAGFGIDVQAAAKKMPKKLATLTFASVAEPELDEADGLRAAYDRVMRLGKHSEVADISVALALFADKPLAIARAKNQIILAIGFAGEKILREMSADLVAGRTIDTAMALFDGLNDSITTGFCNGEDPKKGCGEIVESFANWYRMIAPMIQAQEAMKIVAAASVAKEEAASLEATVESELTSLEQESTGALTLVCAKGHAAAKVQGNRLAQLQVMRQQIGAAKLLLTAGVKAVETKGVEVDGSF